MDTAKNTNIKTSIINNSSSRRYPHYTWLVLMQRPRKKMGNEFTVNDHVLISQFFSIFSLLHTMSRLDYILIYGYGIVFFL